MSPDRVPMNVLIVDDEEDLRTLLKECLEDVADGRIDAAEGRDAIDLVRRHTYDVAVVDMQLGPGLDGTEIIREISAVDDRIRFIVVTGKRELEVVTKLVAALKGPRVVSYLFKPFDVEELVIAATRAAAATPAAVTR